MSDIGAKSAFLSQIVWQLNAKWDRQRMLEAWHRYHPDMPDDLFNELYDKGLCCIEFGKLCREPFQTCTLGELWMRAKQISASRSPMEKATLNG